MAAIRAGKLSQGDARPFCNQLAWLMSGRDADYTGIVDEAEANRYAVLLFVASAVCFCFFVCFCCSARDSDAALPTRLSQSCLLLR